MKTLTWAQMDQAQREQALARPRAADDAQLKTQVSQIVERVRREGDSALLALTAQLDQVKLATVAVDASRIDAASTQVSPEVRQAIDEARGRIEAFHRALVPKAVQVDTAAGVRCERIYRPIDSVGLYIPAGTAPLPSTALMLAVPARLAGCRNIVLCSPPNATGEVDPVVLYVAGSLGVRHIYRVGGAQAVAAMAYGTATVPKCDKIFGPGNAWVTAAKQQVAGDPGGAVIDMPAGPSEVLVVADGAANPAFVAADLLSQAEHGPDSQVILVSDQIETIEQTQQRLAEQLETLPRANLAQQALAHARFIHVDHLSQAMEVSNRYAPEHLILNVEQPRDLLALVRAAGSVFLGPWAPESIGDYCSGTNHVLPTYGYARALSGLGVESFMTAISVQQLSAEGLCKIGRTAEILAAAEGLDAHALAVRLRRQALSNQAKENDQ